MLLTLLPPRWAISIKQGKVSDPLDALWRMTAWYNRLHDSLPNQSKPYSSKFIAQQDNSTWTQRANFQYHHIGRPIHTRYVWQRLQLDTCWASAIKGQILGYQQASSAADCRRRLQIHQRPIRKHKMWGAKLSLHCQMYRSKHHQRRTLAQPRRPEHSQKNVEKKEKQQQRPRLEWYHIKAIEMANKRASESMAPKLPL